MYCCVAPVRTADCSAALPVLQVGWAESGYFFTCMDYSTMMADLNDPAGNCSLSAAGEDPQQQA
jgi:hypothetical protein